MGHAIQVKFEENSSFKEVSKTLSGLEKLGYDFTLKGLRFCEAELPDPEEVAGFRKKKLVRKKASKRKSKKKTVKKKRKPIKRTKKKKRVDRYSASDPRSPKFRYPRKVKKSAEDHLEEPPEPEEPSVDNSVVDQRIEKKFKRLDETIDRFQSKIKSKLSKKQEIKSSKLKILKAISNGTKFRNDIVEKSETAYGSFNYNINWLLNAGFVSKEGLFPKVEYVSTLEGKKLLKQVLEAGKNA